MANSSSRSWSACSQRRVAGRCPTTDAEGRAAHGELGPNRDGLAWDHLLDGDGRRVDEQDPTVDHAEHPCRLAARPARDRDGGSSRVIDSTASRSRRSSELRRDEVAREAHVALGEQRQVVVTGELEARVPAGGDPVHGSGDGAQLAAEVPGQHGGEQQRDDDRDRDREHEHPREGLVVDVGQDQGDDAEGRDGQDRRRHQPERQPGRERGTAAPEGRRLLGGWRRHGDVRRGRRLVRCRHGSGVTSASRRRRGARRHEAVADAADGEQVGRACWGRPPPSGGAAAS